MKNSIIALIAITLFSCNKSSNTASSSSNSITAIIDGVSTTFNIHPTAIKITNSGVNDLSISGLQDNSTNANVIGIVISGSNPITNGTYTSSNINNMGGISYLTNTSDYYMTTGAPESLGTVTINSITNTSVEGTFSGNVEYNCCGTPSIKSVSNGHFKVNF